MFVTIVDNRVCVKLSRRNLRQLDALLEGKDPDNLCLTRRENGVSLVVQVEEDSLHYEGRAPRPGLEEVA